MASRDGLVMGLVDQVDDQNLKVLSILDDSVINKISKSSSNDLSIQFAADSVILWIDQEHKFSYSMWLRR